MLEKVSEIINGVDICIDPKIELIGILLTIGNDKDNEYFKRLFSFTEDNNKYVNEIKDTFNYLYDNGLIDRFNKVKEKYHLYYQEPLTLMLLLDDSFNLNSYQNILTSTLSSGENLNDEELNYIKGITDSLPSVMAEETDVSAAEPFSFGKYSAIGILIGVALVLVVSFFRYTYGRKLVHPYYAEDSYGIETTLLSDSRKTGIERLRYRRVKLFREEQVIQTFENRICQQDVTSAAILTSAASDSVKRFADSLSEALAQKGIHTVLVENPADHPKQNFEIIKEKMPVFIVEEIPHGSKLDADQIISFVNDSGLTILGCCAMV